MNTRQSIRSFIERLRELIVTSRKHQKWPYVVTAIVALVLVVVGINIFIELTDTLTTEVLASYDHEITQYVVSLRNPSLTSFFLFVTNIGDVYGYLVVLGIFLLISLVFFKRWVHVAQSTFVLFLASISNVVLKRFIDRARPGIEHLVSVETLSYPSGHAMSAMAFYGFLIYLFYRFKMGSQILKYGIITLLGALILSIGISRIYLGVHFPSDIAGGFIAGLIWVFFCILLYNLIEVFRRDPKTAQN